MNLVNEHLDVRYLWVDTCCIDKTSSAELSEAINSMCSWYRNSSRCIVYLEDVTTNGIDAINQPSQFGSQFEHSRWFTRGWTLQELLAPEELTFWNRHWGFIGKRSELSNVISAATGIPKSILDKFRIGLHSQAKTVSWAADRATSRKEDMAYCLLGLMSVNMPLLYGEGPRAFHRLQLQVLAQTHDLTMLAWGYQLGLEEQDSSLFVSSPSDYIYCSDFKCERSLDVQRSLGSLVATNRSIHVSLPLLEIQATVWTPKVCCALLPCSMGNIWLVLILEPHLSEDYSTEPLMVKRTSVSAITRNELSWSPYSAIKLKTLRLEEQYSSKPNVLTCGFRWIQSNGLCCTEVYPSNHSRTSDYRSYQINVSLGRSDSLVFFVLRSRHGPLTARNYQEEIALIVVMLCSRPGYWTVSCDRLRILKLQPRLHVYKSPTDLFLHEPSCLNPVHWFDSPSEESDPSTLEIRDACIFRSTVSESVIDFDLYVNFLNNNGYCDITQALGLGDI